jgi:hypothetical protein
VAKRKKSTRAPLLRERTPQPPTYEWLNSWLRGCESDEEHTRALTRKPALGLTMGPSEAHEAACWVMAYIQADNFLSSASTKDVARVFLHGLPAIRTRKDVERDLENLAFAEGYDRAQLIQVMLNMGYKKPTRGGKLK